MVAEVQQQAFDTESKEKIVDHLVFHKSIIDHQRNGDRINDYIQMIEDVGEKGTYHISEDPFECAIASIFKLVIEETMDPWEIDLVSFTNMYLERTKSSESFNFIVAGQIVKMAWSILRMQCEKVLDTAVTKEEQEECLEDDFISQWDIFDYDMYEEPEDIDFEDKLQGGDPPIERVVRRKDRKPVSLINLVDAFEDAKNEALHREKMERLREERSEERKKAEKERKKNYDATAHKEDLQHDISVIWERICWYHQKSLEFGMIHNDRLNDLITAFISILFLHRDSKIKVTQTNFPLGQIMLENLTPENERPKVEKDPQVLENIVTI